MNQEWVMTLFSATILVLTTAVAWVASELRRIRTDLRYFVVKEDCKLDMDGHCQRIASLEEQIKNNTTDIQLLKQYNKITRKKH